MRPSLNVFPVRLKASSSRSGKHLAHYPMCCFSEKNTLLHASKASASCTFLHLNTFMQPCLGNETWVERRRYKYTSHLREALKCERMGEVLGVLRERKCSGNSFWNLHQCHHTSKKKFLLVLCAGSSGCASEEASGRVSIIWCLCRSYCATESEPLAQDQY